ncbi:MAG: fatty acid desaturase [Acidimicrobiales bacterium]|nr:fatty acid desaturase [Acidimicrobiales bacterium]
MSALVATQIAIITTTVYLHRALTHRALAVRQPLDTVFRVLTWVTTGIRPRQWVAVHRKHHAHCDTAEDPHSPAQLGWLRVQLTNVALYRRAAKDPAVQAKYAKDLPGTKLDHLLFDRAWLGLGIGVVLLCLLIGIVPGLIAAGVHFVAYVGLSGAVNSVGHTFGKRPYANSATNLRWLTLAAGGEGLHNHHHAAPTSARFATKWSDLDVGWAVIRVAKLFHLVEIRHDDVDALARRGVSV